MLKKAVPGLDSRSWLLEKFALGSLNYWFAFIADASSALFFLGWEISHRPHQLGSIFGGVVLGYLIWTLTEYVFHRWIYHRKAGIFGEGHRIHHTEAKTLIAMPWAITSVTVFALWHIFSQKWELPYFSAVLSGWLFGFVFYSLVHHSHHHWNVTNTWFRRLKAFHKIHHHFPETNYGVTMRFWDHFFKTVYQKAGSGVKELHAEI